MKANTLIFLLIILLLPRCISIFGHEKSKEHRILDYLHKKYKTEFTIKNIIPMKEKKCFHAIVSPTEDTEIEFMVYYSKSPYSLFPQFTDSYNQVKFVHSIKKSADSYCLEHFGVPISSEYLIRKKLKGANMSAINRLYIEKNNILTLEKQFIVTEENIDFICDELSQLVSLVKAAQTDVSFHFVFFRNTQTEPLNSRNMDHMDFYIKPEVQDFRADSIKNLMLKSNPFLMQYHVVGIESNRKLGNIVDGYPDTAWGYYDKELNTINENLPYVEIELDRVVRMSKIRLKLDYENLHVNRNKSYLLGFNKVLIEDPTQELVEVIIGKSISVKLDENHTKIIIEKELQEPFFTKHFKFKLDDFYIDSELVKQGHLRIEEVYFLNN